MSEWYYASNNQRLGPVSTDQLRQLATSGKLSPGDLVWKDGMGNWAAASTIPGLFPAPAAASAPIPAPQPGYAPSPAAPPKDQVFDLGPQDAIRAPRDGGGEGGDMGALLQQIGMRAVSWNLDAIAVLPGEKAELNAANVTGETAQRYLVWRRSLLWVVLVPTALTAILNTISSIVNECKIFNAFGILVEVGFMLTWFALPAAVVVAALSWSNARLSQRIVSLGYAVSFVLPLLMTLLPNMWFLDVKGGGGPDSFGAALVGAMGLFALFKVLPILLSLVPGIMRASLRLKTLLPESLLPGLFLVAVAPIGSIVFLATVFTLNQMSDNFVVMVAVFVLMLAPLLFAVSAGTMILPLSSPAQRQAMTKWQFIYLGAQGGAALLVVIYMIIVMASDKGGPPVFGFLRVYVDFLGRSLYTTVAASQLLLWASMSGTRKLQEAGKSDLAAAADKRLAELEPIAGKL
jgi:hypothetical protein